MVTPTGGAARLARALALAVTTIALAILAHLLGGGGLPGPGVLVVLGAVVAVTALVASGRRLGAPAIGALLAGGQVLLHGAFTVLATSAAEPAALGQVVGHGHHAQLVVPAAQAHTGASTTALHAAAPPMAWHGAAHHHAALPMLLAHLAATLLTAAVLARGERALWLLAQWLVPVVRAVRPRVVHRPRPVLPALALPRPAAVAVVLVAPRRGPPLSVCPA